MTISLQSPPLVPDLDRAVFLVLDDFGSLGRAWRETDDLEAVLPNLLRGQYHDPVKVVGFNASEAWSMDVSAGVAQAIRRTCGEEVPDFLQSFVHRHDPEEDDQLQLPFARRGMT